MICGTDCHCCQAGDSVCEFLEETSERRYSCRLRRELGSWELVHSDPRYKNSFIGKWWENRNGRGCGDWPLPGQACAECGVSG